MAFFFAILLRTIRSLVDEEFAARVGDDHGEVAGGDLAVETLDALVVCFVVPGDTGDVAAVNVASSEPSVEHSSSLAREPAAVSLRWTGSSSKEISQD